MNKQSSLLGERKHQGREIVVVISTYFLVIFALFVSYEEVCALFLFFLIEINLSVMLL